MICAISVRSHRRRESRAASEGNKAIYIYLSFEHGLVYLALSTSKTPLRLFFAVPTSKPEHPRHPFVSFISALGHIGFAIFGANIARILVSNRLLRPLLSFPEDFATAIITTGYLQTSTQASGTIGIP